MSIPCLKIQMSGEPTKAEMETISAGLLAHHATAGHPRKEDVFSILSHDDKGALVAAIVCSCLWGRMYLRQFWVAEHFRNQGIGSDLLKLAEVEGIRKGCRHAHTDTFSWQAPEFYIARGYREFGILEDFPPGSSLRYLTKDLLSESAINLDSN